MVKVALARDLEMEPVKVQVQVPVVALEGYRRHVSILNFEMV